MDPELERWKAGGQYYDYLRLRCVLPDRRQRPQPY